MSDIRNLLDEILGPNTRIYALDPGSLFSQSSEDDGNQEWKEITEKPKNLDFPFKAFVGDYKNLAVPTGHKTEVTVVDKNNYTGKGFVVTVDDLNYHFTPSVYIKEETNPKDKEKVVKAKLKKVPTHFDKNRDGKLVGVDSDGKAVYSIMDVNEPELNPKCTYIKFI